MKRIRIVLALVTGLALAIMLVPRGTPAAGFPFVGGFQWYDDFGSLLLDRNLWLPMETGGGFNAPNLETFRGIVLTKTSSQAQLMLHSWGSQDGNTGSTGSGQRLDFANPGAITAILAQVTVTNAKVLGCTANTTSSRARAQIIGRVFNLGTSSGSSDQTGDVLAGIQLVQDSLTKALIEAFVVSCADAQCNSLTDHLPPGAGLFTTTWALNKPLYYGIQLDKATKRLIAAVLDQNFNEIEAPKIFDYGAAGLSDTDDPVLQRKSLQIANRTAHCLPPGKRTDANMTVLFDNVFVNQ